MDLSIASGSKTARGLFAVTPAKGARTPLWVATAPELA